MQVLRVVLALSLATATGAGDSFGSGEGSTTSETTFTVATVGELEDQLLSTSNLDVDLLVQVYTDFNAMQSDFSAGIAVPIESANSTTFASVLVVSNSSGDPTGTDALSARTQLYYNCTSAPFIWNLLDDTNVVALVHFQSRLQGDSSAGDASSSFDVSSGSASRSTFPRDSSAGGSASGNNGVTGAVGARDSSVSGSTSGTEAAGLRADDTVVATATLAIANCGVQRNYSAQQLLLGNAFFGDEFVNTTTYFRVVASSQVEPAAGQSGECHVHLELARAGLQDIYPDCKIKFHSTDLGALLNSKGAATVENDLTGGEKQEAAKEKQRRLGASSFDFLRHPSCYHECGYSTEMDQCYGYVSGEPTLFSCTLALYATNPYCDEECGDSPRSMADIPVSQCYNCNVSAWCSTGTTRYGIECCSVYNCQRISESAETTPKALTWNLQSDAMTVNNREVEIYSRGDCSDLTDLTSDCCLLTCLDCFANLTVTSLFADVDVYATDLTVDAEMVVRGNTNMTLKLFAPTGCTYESTRTLLSFSADIPISTGLSVTVEVAYDALARATIRPHGSTAVFGVESKIDRVSAGFKDFDNKFRDIQIRSQMHRNLKQAGLDATAYLALIPQAAVTLNLFGSTASVGVRLKYEVYAELQATVVFPAPMPALSTAAYNPNSLFWLGDCRTPHFMTYDVFVGAKNIVFNFPVTVAGFTPLNPTLTLNSVRFSVISGCVASAYKTRLLLSIGVNAVATWANDHQLKLLDTVLRLLNFTDIDRTSLELSEVSDSDGRLYLTLQVPPSMVDEFPTASVFTQACNSRARTSAFRDQLSSAVGMQMAAACDDGWWGVTCSLPCSSVRCRSGTCNSVDGAMTSCSACTNNYWGSMCTSTCDLSNTHCASSAAATCDKDTGSLVSCGGFCASGYSGDTCSTPTPTPSPTTETPTPTPTTETPTPVSVGTPGGSSGRVHSPLVEAAWGGVWLGLVLAGLT